MSSCYHGGSAFKALGEDFSQLDRLSEVIAADVLDAWFPPAPSAIQVLQDNHAWALQTAPPAHAGGLLRTICELRRLPAASVAVGAGSSDLIYRVLPKLLSPASKVLLLNPMYGEYEHFCNIVMDCAVESFQLPVANHFRVDVDKLISVAGHGYDLVVIVNPNNPTGQTIPSDQLMTFVQSLPQTTICWIDETYIDFTHERSLEPLASQSPNVVVIKSLSKCLALSGARVGYLVSSQDLIDTVRMGSPPWLVSLPAQLTAISALREPDYYQECYRLTRTLRSKLATAVSKMDPAGIVFNSVGNWILWQPSAQASVIVDRCQERGLFLRLLPQLNAIRIAVKDDDTQSRMLGILSQVWDAFSRTESLASSR